jgi:sugar lactone lactonase YvrE
MTSTRRLNMNSTLRMLALALAASVPALLAGCSGSLPSNFGVAQPTGAVQLAGKVYGGQNPVVGASIQLYGVSSTMAGAASPLISSPPLSVAGGQFSITGMYSCAGVSDVYLVATGGNSGSGTNSNMTLVAALGQCSNLTPSTTILVNELTTVAAAYALAPFSTGYLNVGGTNATALDTAFQTANVLVVSSTGVAGSGAGTGVTVPTTELNTLGNILAACVNTQGAASAQCTQLFTATGTSETFGAALAMAHAPGASTTTGLYTLSSAQAPFQPSMALASAPNDFSVALSYAGANGTLSTPYAIAIDGSGNAWVTNETGTTVTEFSPTGSVLATPTATGLVGAEGIAVAPGGTVWVANTAGNSLVAFATAAGQVTATNVYTGNGLSGPTAVALDLAGNAFVSNLNGNSVSGFTSTGGKLSYSPITDAGLSTPHSIACGGANSDVYVTSGTGAVLHFSDASGALVDTLTDNTLQGPVSVFYDLQASHLFVTGYTTGTAIAGALGEFVSNDSPAAVSPVTTGLNSPAGVAADGTSAWVANGAAGGSLAQFAYGTATPNSPVAGFGSLNAPVGVAVDASGSVWTANSGSNTVSVFVGLAKPVVTPISANQK